MILLAITVTKKLDHNNDEITRWTASFDKYFHGGRTLVTVAAGNSGESDDLFGLNRIQPPSDAVNVLSVGACNSEGEDWRKCSYSSVGPGRCPGVVKPDGVIFGGCDEHPFMVLNSHQGKTVGVQGTSFSAPYALRSGIFIKQQTGNNLSALAIKALMIHKAENNTNTSIDVGWGKFQTDYNKLIRCQDNEALVIYQGDLPIKNYLRALIPVPDMELKGNIILSATLVISPEVDPEYPNAYTRAGLEVVFRPDGEKYGAGQNGKKSTCAKTKSFFSDKQIYSGAEYALREDGHKWEPCLKSTTTCRSKSINKPCFDIYYHKRGKGESLKEIKPLSYALVITVKAPKVLDFYNKILQKYNNILIPLHTNIRTQIR